MRTYARSRRCDSVVRRMRKGRSGNSGDGHALALKSDSGESGMLRLWQPLFVVYSHLFIFF